MALARGYPRTHAERDLADSLEGLADTLVNRVLGVPERWKAEEWWWRREIRRAVRRLAPKRAAEVSAWLRTDYARLWGRCAGCGGVAHEQPWSGCPGCRLTPGTRREIAQGFGSDLRVKVQDEWYPRGR